MRRTVLVPPLVLLIGVGTVFFTQCRGKGERQVSGVALQENILERRVKGAQTILETARKGEVIDFDQVLVTIDQRLVRQLLEGATPYERVIDDKYRIRINSAEVDFKAGFALVQLSGRGSLVGGEDETVAADVKVYGVFEVTGIDPESGVLRAHVNVIGLEIPQVQVSGMSVSIQSLVDRLAHIPLDKLNALASDLEIPVALDQEVKIPQVGPEGEVKIAAATVPLRVAVKDVKVMANKVWVAIQVDVKEGDGQAPDSAAAAAARAKAAVHIPDAPAGPIRFASRTPGAPPTLFDGPQAAQAESAAAPAQAESSGGAAVATPDSVSPRMKELQAHFDAVIDSIKVATAADTLLWEVATDSGEVALGLKPELIQRLVQEATGRYLRRVELDINLEEEVDEGETVKVKAAFGKMVTAGSWKVHVTIHRIQAVLAANAPKVSVVEENRLRVQVPVKAVSGYGTATIEFTWDAAGVVSAACHDFHAKVDVDGNAVPRDYNVTGDLVLGAVGDRIVAVPEFPVQKIRVSVAPSQATWAKVRSTMAGLSDMGKCGIGMKVLSPDKITALLDKVLTKGFNIKLPTKIVPTLTFPASVSESVKIEGREVQLAVKPRLLRVTPRAFWYSANVTAGVREIQPEQNPAGVGEKGAEAGKGAT